MFRFLGALLILVLCLSAHAWAGQAEGPSEGGGVICYNKEKAAVIPVPDGWVADRQAGARLGVCSIFYPKGFSFDSAPVIMYPRLMTSEHSGQEAIEASVEMSRGYFGSRPGGERTRIEHVERVGTAEGREFQLYSLQDGPPPNNFEFIAYSADGHNLLLLVLSSRDKASLDAALPQLRKTMEGAVEMEVRIEREAR